MRKLQAGKESTAGTLVAATRLIGANWAFSELTESFFPDYPRGFRAPTGGATGVITQRMSRLEVTTDLNAEEILWPMSTGVLGTPTPSGTPPLYQRLYAPQLTTGILTMDTATIEMVATDGVTNHYYGEFGHALTESIDINYRPNTVPELKWVMFGRARQTGTPTGSLVEYPTRESLASQLMAVYVDTTWAGLGGTQQVCIVTQADFHYNTGLMPVFNASGRPDLDMCTYSVGQANMQLKLTVELNAVGATMLAAWRARSAQFIRIIYTGNAIGAGVKTVRIDGAYRFVAGSNAEISDGENGNMTVGFELEGFVDPTTSKMVEFTDISGLATI